MSWMTRHIDRLMLLCGALTFTMVYAAIAPEAALQSSFGANLEGPVADVVVRNWGALIALIGAMLMYAARKPALRPFALTISAMSKVVFIALVVRQGSTFLSYGAGIAVVVDAFWVIVFVAYLFSIRGATKPGVTATAGV